MTETPSNWVLMLRFPLHRASFDAQEFLNEGLGDETDEPDPQADQQPHGAVLAGLGLLGQVQDDEHHVGDGLTSSRRNHFRSSRRPYCAAPSQTCVLFQGMLRFCKYSNT